MLTSRLLWLTVLDLKTRRKLRRLMRLKRRLQAVTPLTVLPVMLLELMDPHLLVMDLQVTAPPLPKTAADRVATATVQVMRMRRAHSPTTMVRRPKRGRPARKSARRKTPWSPLPNLKNRFRSPRCALAAAGWGRRSMK